MLSQRLLYCIHFSCLWCEMGCDGAIVFEKLTCAFSTDRRHRNVAPTWYFQFLAHRFHMVAAELQLVQRHKRWEMPLSGSQSPLLKICNNFELWNKQHICGDGLETTEAAGLFWKWLTVCNWRHKERATGDFSEVVQPQSFSYELRVLIVLQMAQNQLLKWSTELWSKCIRMQRASRCYTRLLASASVFHLSYLHISVECWSSEGVVHSSRRNLYPCRDIQTADRVFKSWAVWNSASLCASA